jgi:FixJ family two-component response regulator
MEKLISRPNVVDFVTKPFSVASLNEALAKAIAMKSSAS